LICAINWFGGRRVSYALRKAARFLGISTRTLEVVCVKFSKLGHGTLLTYCSRFTYLLLPFLCSTAKDRFFIPT
jgi:hypothetical protein